MRLLTPSLLRTVDERLVGRLEVKSDMVRVFVRMIMAEGWELLVVNKESQ